MTDYLITLNEVANSVAAVAKAVYKEGRPF